MLEVSSVIREQPSLHGSVLSLICHVDFQIILCRAVARIHVHGGVHHGLHNEHQIVLTPFESVPPPRVKMCIVPAGRDCFFFCVLFDRLSNVLSAEYLHTDHCMFVKVFPRI